MHKEIRKGVEGALNPNYDDLNRFIASMGIRAIVLGYFVIFSYLYFVSNFDIPNPFLTFIVLFVVPSLSILAGFIAIYYGIEGWKDRQEKLDEKLDLEVEMKKRELESEELSNEDVEEAEFSSEGDEISG